MKNKVSLRVGRREFIQVSSAVAAGALLLGRDLLASETAVIPTRLAVGFADWILDTAKLPIDVESAQAIRGTDGAFLSRDAQISVVSSGRAPIDPKERRAVQLNANFSYREGGDQRVAPFYAWTYDRTTGRSGPRANFMVPLDDQQAIRLSVGKPEAPAVSRRRAIGGSGAASSLPFTLSLRSEPDSYRLVRGFYIIVPLIDGESEPAWSSCSLWYRDGHWGLHEGGDKHPVTFEHLVLQVSYAR